MANINDLDGPLRTQWQAQFSADELIAECTTRKLNHYEHAKYWSMKLESLRAELEESQTIETQKITGGEQRVLRYDQGLANKVTNAESRRDSHRSRASEYDRWIMLLEKKRGTTLPLRIDDVTFFFAEPQELPE